MSKFKKGDRVVVVSDHSRKDCIGTVEAVMQHVSPKLYPRNIYVRFWEPDDMYVNSFMESDLIHEKSYIVHNILKEL